jgi:death on curing protein
MFYLSAADVYEINQQVTGHEPVVRDRHLLRSAVARPFRQMFGQEAYPTLAEKAAALLHALAHDHLFVDGNKRTAQRAVTRFLQQNGAEIRWADEDAQTYILEIAKGRCDVPEIAEWLTDHIALTDAS